jgi:hypothetical protein
MADLDVHGRCATCGCPRAYHSGASDEGPCDGGCGCQRFVPGEIPPPIVDDETEAPDAGEEPHPP